MIAREAKEKMKLVMVVVVVVARREREGARESQRTDIQEGKRGSYFYRMNAKDLHPSGTLP